MMINLSYLPKKKCNNINKNLCMYMSKFEQSNQSMFQSIVFVI